MAGGAAFVFNQKINPDYLLVGKYRVARLGLLLCPITSFAALLCELGQKRARENSVTERSPVYSGMMSY